jgi:ribose transport system permease protein
MKKLLGLALFLLVIYFLLLLSDPGARSAYNHVNLGRRIGLFGIISLGAGILIITGGIDLSIGSVIGLCATVFATLLVEHRWNPLAAIAAVLALGACIGIANGLLATKLRVQAFVVTLCGLFIYRGAARWLAGDQVKGLGTEFESLKYWLSDSKDVLGLPMSLVIFCLLAVIASVFLHMSVYGRYLFAVGSNDQAARYSGIAVDRYRILAYVICSSLAALFSILFLLEQNSVQPSNTGSFFELYAIAGAVLGGCSLRGGEGSVLGVIIGTAILWILPNFTKMWGVPSQLEYTVIGAALLIGALLDEGLRRRGLSRARS